MNGFERTPIAARLQPSILRRRWLLTLQHDIPSWLTSFLFHITIVALLASYITPDKPGSKLGTLVESWAHEHTDLQSDVVFEPQSPDGRLDNQIEVTEQVVSKPDIIGVGGNEQVSAATTDDYDRVLKELEWVVVEKAHQARPSPTEHSQSEQLCLVAPTYLVNYRPSLGGNHAIMQRSNADAVVNAFIEYDIGRLRGSAGVRANRNFQNLGPEAVPALVRGLNRSLSIKASCPVAVLSSKLISTLSNADDPTAITYALNHIGRGVPPNAPHRNRVLQLDRILRKRLSE